MIFHSCPYMFRKTLYRLWSGFDIDNYPCLWHDVWYLFFVVN
jgi:hypothetical protein